MCMTESVNVGAEVIWRKKCACYVGQFEGVWQRPNEEIGLS